MMNFSDFKTLNISSPDFSGDMMMISKITEDGKQDTIWRRMFNVSIGISPNDIGESIISNINNRDKMGYGEILSFKVTNESNAFIEWSDGEKNLEHTDVIISSEYSINAIFDSDITDYYDSETEPIDGNFTLKLQRGQYYAILVGSGGDGGRTSPGEYYIQGAFGGGSGSCLSATFKLDEISVINCYRSTDSLNTFIRDGKNLQDTNLYLNAGSGKDGYFGWYQCSGGAGGTVNYTIGAIFKQIWNGKKGESVNNGNSANGGYYANDDFKYGGGQAKGATNYGTNKGKSYEPKRGYIHIERYIEVRFFNEMEQIGSTMYVKRNTTVTPPDTPTREGYKFNGWSQSLEIEENDVEIYAKWLKPITLSYESDGGETTPSSHTIESESEYATFTLANEISKDGYIFKGWKINGIIYDPQTTVTLDQNTTAVAQWEEVPQEDIG